MLSDRARALSVNIVLENDSPLSSKTENPNSLLVLRFFVASYGYLGEPVRSIFLEIYN